MILFLFVFLSWITISVFSLISKGLTMLENFITFFCITITIINISTITDLNMKLVYHSSKPDLFISYLIHRNIIMPLCLLIFVNLTFLLKTKFTKFILGAVTIFILFYTEMLTLWAGIKTYTGWNELFNFLSMGILMSLSVFFARMLKKL